MDENKKICKKCGRKRKLGKFGKRSCNKDGKNIYCRDCMQEFRDDYKKTSKGKLIQKKCVEKYQSENKEELKKYYEEYYIKNKNRIIYNIKAKKETESILIYENKEKGSKKKINNRRKDYEIIINPQRKT